MNVSAELLWRRHLAGGIPKLSSAQNAGETPVPQELQLAQQKN
jgi:hypothetical protein